MLSLKVLGGVAIFRDNVAHPWPERGWQRAALMAVLADGGTRGVTREVLTALLWPDSDEADARHSLDELLSRARRELGEKQLFDGVGSVRLNRDLMSCDLNEFEGAIADGHLERAVALYHGDFADGLRVGASAELERRVAAIRRRTATRYMDALTELATRATRQGAHSRAAAWWRMAMDADSLSVNAVLGLITALHETRDDIEALRVARAHRLLARESFGREDARVADWIRRLEAADSAGGRTAPSERDSSRTIRIDTPEVMESPSEARRLALLGRLLGAGYRPGSLVDEGTIAAVYSVHCVDGTRREAHLVQSQIAATMWPAAFQHAFGKVMRLAHAGIVPTHEVRASSEGLVAVCGVHPRPRLRDTLKRQRGLPIATAIDIATRLADALRVAHQHQCVHGDLRPKHVAILGTEVILGGFGFAEALAARASDDRSTLVTMGSPRYQCPEQLNGELRHDESWDIYALGTMLFEMLAGQVPFQIEGRDALMKLREAAPRLRTIRDTIPTSLDEIVAIALARYAADRFTSMGEFHAALTAL
jgi:DNA-binding SARP family transcriptional activator